jgi:hypothetical protein
VKPEGERLGRCRRPGSGRPARSGLQFGDYLGGVEFVGQSGQGQADHGAAGGVDAGPGASARRCSTLRSSLHDLKYDGRSLQGDLPSAGALVGAITEAIAVCDRVVREADDAAGRGL